MFKRKRILKRAFKNQGDMKLNSMHSFASIFACFELSFKAFEIFNFQFSPAGHFLVKIYFILVQICEQKFIRGFNPLGGKNDNISS